jgi:hypothetical protein
MDKDFGSCDYGLYLGTISGQGSMDSISLSIEVLSLLCYINACSVKSTNP